MLVSVRFKYFFYLIIEMKRALLQRMNLKFNGNFLI